MVTLLLATGLLASIAVAAEPSTATWVGGVKQLFVDSSLIASTRGGVTQVMNTPTKIGSRVLQPDAAWEKALDTNFALYDTVLREERGGRNVTRLWYFNVRGDSNSTARPYMQSYAESPDGLAFTKPSLGQDPLNGTPAAGLPNNVLGALSGEQQREGVSVWVDPHETLRGRYVTQAKVKSGPSAGMLAFSVSRDGLIWNASHEFQPGAGGCDTQSVVFYDTRRAEYALYTRQWERPPATNRDAYRTVRRLSARTDNKHGLQWTSQQIVVAPDAFDNATHSHDEFQEPPVDYYGGIAYQYPEAGNGSYYFMLLPRLHHWTDSTSGWTAPMSKPGGPAIMDVGLAVSRDGINFTQVGGRMPFIPAGPSGGWESQMTWGLPSPVIMPGGTPERPSPEIWIYYAGTNTNHDGVVDTASVTGAKQSGISIARLRLDGWMSMDAPLTALSPGKLGASEIVTVPLVFEGSRLELNVDASGQGAIYVEIQSSDGKPLEGFALADALPVITNGVNVEVRWQDKAAQPTSDVRRIAGQSVRLRFVMTGCKLFAFQFAKAASIHQGLKTDDEHVEATDPPAPSLIWGAPGFELELDSRTFELRNLSVSSVDRAYTQTFVLNTATPPKRTQNALWTLNVSDCTVAIPHGLRINPCIGAYCANTSYELSADNSTLTLHWRQVRLPAPMQEMASLDVTVIITKLPMKRSGVSLRSVVALSVPNHSSLAPARLCLQSFALPTLGSIPLQTPETDAMFVPYYFGHTGQCSGNCKMDLLASADGMHNEFAWMPNGGSRAMQWFAYSSNRTGRSLGLYAAAHDPLSRLQLALTSGEYTQPDGSGGGAALHWWHIPDDPLATLTPATPWQMPYEVVLQGFESLLPYDSPWYDAAQIYREWATANASWTRHGDIRTRLSNQKFPEYLTTTPFLIESNVGKPSAGNKRGADPSDTIANMVKIREMLGAKEMIVWWSSWNVECFDCKYPQFTPRQGFKERVQEMRKGGIHVVPYTNGRLMDPSIPKFRADDAIRHMCNSSDGPYREIYHTTGPAANISFFIADPADQYWQDTFIDIAKEMKDAGVDGLYIDQLASFFPQPCFGRADGPPAGSGWADGGRKIFSDVATALGPNAAVFSESNAEAYIGDLHGNMALYGFEKCGFVPAFQAVFSGYTVNAGILEWPVPNKTDKTLRTWATNKPGQNESTNLPSWMAYSALQLVYGHVPGAMMTEDLLFVLENSAGALAFWRDIVQIRVDATDYLVFGKLLRPPQLIVPLQTVSMCGNKPLNHFPCCPVETVVANVWQAPNGSIALIVANHGTEPTKYEARADLGSTSHSIAVTLPPTSARIVVLTESETVVAVSRVVEQPQLHSEEGASAGTAPGICDIYAHGGTPCVAAHSMTRALYAEYDGPLFSLLRSDPNATTDIGVAHPGGIANTKAAAVFCRGAPQCIVTRIFDQSPLANNLGIEKGFAYLTPPRNSQDAGVDLHRSPNVTLGGAPVFSAVFDTQCDVHEGNCDGLFNGYSNRTAAGTPVGDEPQSVYALFDGTHYSTGCCFDYGNAEKNNGKGMGGGAMEAVYYGCGDKGPNANGTLPSCEDAPGKGAPYVMADLERMHDMMNVLPPQPLRPIDFVAAFVKGTATELSIKAGDASSTKDSLQTLYEGPRPQGWESKKQGAIVLGIGGDNSPWGAGTFFEGVMVKGFSSNATDEQVMANIVAAGYVKHVRLKVDGDSEA